MADPNLGGASAARGVFGRQDPRDLMREASRIAERDPKRAASLLGRVLRAEPDNREALYRRGLLLNRARKYTDAVTCFDALLSLDPQDVRAHINRGISMAEMGDTESAALSYERAMAADPRCAPARFNRGVLHDRLGEHEKALEMMDEAVRLDPSAEGPLFYRGIVLAKSGRHRESLECFEKVGRKFPGHRDALFHRGIEHAELGEHELALPVFEQLLSGGPNANVEYAKARSLAALGRDGEALALLERAVKASPKQIRAWMREEKSFARLRQSEKFRKLAKL